MYSVCRFVATSDGNENKLSQIGSALNMVRPGQFERLDRRGGRFSVSISTADTWQAHLIAIREFVHAMSGVISVAISEGLLVEIDLAIEPEDVGAVPFVSYAVPSLTLSELGTRGVTLVFTQYK
jgi:hypothetical protein